MKFYLKLMYNLFIYYYTILQRYYRHFELKEKKDAERRVAENKGIKEKIPYLRILKNSWPQLYNVFFVFFVTLAVFPSMHSSTYLLKLNLWYF